MSGTEILTQAKIEENKRKENKSAFTILKDFN